MPHPLFRTLCGAGGFWERGSTPPLFVAALLIPPTHACCPCPRHRFAQPGVEGGQNQQMLMRCALQHAPLPRPPSP